MRSRGVGTSVAHSCASEGTWHVLSAPICCTRDHARARAAEGGCGGCVFLPWCWQAVRERWPRSRSHQRWPCCGGGEKGQAQRQASRLAGHGAGAARGWRTPCGCCARGTHMLALRHVSRLAAGWFVWRGAAHLMVTLFVVLYAVIVSLPFLNSPPVMDTLVWGSRARGAMATTSGCLPGSGGRSSTEPAYPSKPPPTSAQK